MTLNTKVSAAFSRRKMLLGLASASAAAATTSAEAASKSDNPELIALGDELPQLVSRYHDAADEVARIIEKWGPKWPKPNPEIVRFGPDCKTHRHIDGRGIKMKVGKSDTMDVQKLGTPEYFERSTKWHWAEYERKSRTKSQRGAKQARRWAEIDEAMIAPSRAYWSEVERITRASNIIGAQKASRKALDVLRAQVESIMESEDRTIAGTMIKAQALEAWGAVDDFSQALNVEGPKWANQLAKSILRHAIS